MRLVVIGGDAAGMSAAPQARRILDESQLEIVAFERGGYSSYGACGLPYLVAEQVDEADALVSRTPEQHRANGIDLHMRHEALSVDSVARTVRVRNLEDGGERDEAFDHLVIAVGASPVRPNLDGSDARGIHGIQTIEDGTTLRAHLDEPGEHRAVVVGAGYVGIEMAEAMHHRGIPVTVIERGPQPLGSLDPDMGALVADAMRNLGIELLTDTSVEGFETDDRGHVSAVVTRDRSFPADVVVLGLGVRPNVDVAKTAGVTLGSTGAIATDARMETNVEGVWAAGDCVETHHRVTKRGVYIPLGTHANKQGRIAGMNIGGMDATFPGVVGTAITKICAYEVGRTGVDEAEARNAGIDVVSATIESTTRAGYYPDAQPITVKVLGEKGTGRLVGAQIVGREGAAKRIDVLSTAIWNEMTAEEVTMLDLGYAPPFSPVWDPVLIAARKLAGLL